MEPNSPRKIQFTVPLLEPHLDPEAAEQVRGHRGDTAGTPGGRRRTEPGGLRGAAGTARAGGGTESVRGHHRGPPRAPPPVTSPSPGGCRGQGGVWGGPHGPTAGA
uniref:Protein phosphatase 1 regulatory subunit 1A n=1 Tax=Cyanoderma ruficeps TaxID=181631 RepID=A0A8C3NZA8_9PASS